MPIFHSTLSNYLGGQSQETSGIRTGSNPLEIKKLGQEVPVEIQRTVFCLLLRDFEHINPYQPQHFTQQTCWACVTFFFTGKI